ncbi:MAG: NAD-dependent DNA ligase (contains BRCT domain type II) [Rhodobacteraceae bacterium HLUCCA08]|nr:MAG: NAD-dependent DNA ligase (contains BRCT domain type II) [Rhodobacteraceae bacterium HLUCCA08]
MTGVRIGLGLLVRGGGVEPHPVSERGRGCTVAGAASGAVAAPKPTRPVAPEGRRSYPEVADHTRRGADHTRKGADHSWHAFGVTRRLLGWTGCSDWIRCGCGGDKARRSEGSIAPARVRLSLTLASRDKLNKVGLEVRMLEHDGPDLRRIHARNNDRKFFCHFTGFLEGIAASGYVEIGEVAPLIAESEAFVSSVSDGDASDIIQDFDADILEHNSIKDIVTIRASEIDEACEKSALNRFLGFCRGIVCDGRITTKEASYLVELAGNLPDLSAVVGVSQIIASCEDAVADGIVTPEESHEICEVIGAIVGDCYADTGMAQTRGVANLHEHKLTDIHVDLDGRILVLTGKFKTTPRSKLEDELRSFGAIVVRHVSGKTDFVVVGGEASRDWIELNRGTKLRKAQELRMHSDSPLFVSESQLLRHLAFT